jgi:hypothetical protein
MIPAPQKTHTTNLYCLKEEKQPTPATDREPQATVQDRADVPKKDGLHCALCRYPITHTSERIVKNEKHQHVFANPHGYIYQIGCFGQAPGCVVVGQETSHFSWFPGYTWRVALCGRCFSLLGWAFRSPEGLFFGLVLDKLISEENYE